VRWDGERGAVDKPEEELAAEGGTESVTALDGKDIGCWVRSESLGRRSAEVVSMRRRLGTLGFRGRVCGGW
jgi:hypothetical protein